jgi:hypothetical protein
MWSSLLAHLSGGSSVARDFERVGVNFVLAIALVAEKVLCATGNFAEAEQHLM